MSFNVVCSSQNIVDLPPIHKEFFPEHIYDRQSLLDIGNAYKHQLSPEAAEKLQGLCLLRKPNLETAASPTDATRTRRRRKRCERGRKEYLPWEFTAIVIGAVYIPPCANAKDALRELYCAISEQQTNNPDGFFIIAFHHRRLFDFNHANLKTVLPKFYQHVNFATRGNNTLDFVYTTEKKAYKAVPTSGTQTTSLLC